MTSGLYAADAARLIVQTGAILAGGIGAVVGLVVGLNVYAATAWFAVFEVGIPAAAVGSLLGFVASGIVEWAQGDVWDETDGGERCTGARKDMADDQHVVVGSSARPRGG